MDNDNPVNNNSYLQRLNTVKQLISGSSLPGGWQPHLEKILSGMEHNNSQPKTGYHYLETLHALLQKNPQSALRHIKTSSLAVSELNSHLAEAFNYISISRILIELGEFENAESWLKKAAALTEELDSGFLMFNLLLTRTELDYTLKNDIAGLNALSQAMIIGRDKNYINTEWWNPDVICDLCIKALENNIQVDYVQKLIIKSKLFPDDPPLHLDNWPWKVRLYTLGRFSILIDGKPATINGKGKNRQIELLKALIAKGGREVSEALLCEALWPDAEGDNAHSSYTSTLSRLRKLTGNDTLQVNNGLLSLNDHLCWLDIWAYKRCLGKLESALAHPETLKLPDLEKKQRRLFSLYHGLFMEKEPQMGCMLPERERLQTMLLRIIKQMIRFYSSRGQCEKVINLYEKALELDPLSEEYYRGLMLCHAASGNSGKALAIYDNCQSILNVTFAIKPSEKTTQLYKTIKTDDSSQLQRCCALCSQNTSA